MWGVRLAVVAGTLTLGGSACVGLPPQGEVLVMVDTDLPIAFGNHLRIDLFRPDGTWYDSRDFPIPNLDGWPASFGIVSSDPSNVTPVYARLRVYPDGQTRDYVGELYHDNSPITPAYVPTSVSDMCVNALPLSVGGTVVGRRGLQAFIPMLSGDDCDGSTNETGTVAAVVDIPTAGNYEFGVLASSPPNDQPYEPGQPPLYPFQQATLELRTVCNEESSSIACDVGWGSGTSPDGEPRVTAFLKPGPVYVVVGGIDSAAAGPLDVVIAAWSTEDSPPSNDTFPTPPPPQPVPLALSVGTTPTSEPEPGATIDRLVLLEVPTSQVVAARVTLPGACLGAMSMLATNGAIDLSAAQTCASASDLFEPVTPLTLDADTTLAPTLARTFGAATPCPPVDPMSNQVCVEGGPFILGGRNTVGSSPVRTVAVSTFWMDPYETTVGDYRASGLPADDIDGPLGLVNGQNVGCTWSPSPTTMENYPLQCISYFRARQYCQAQSVMGQQGDLPTEAQWEYAATVAGRPEKTLFAWGNDPPQCTCDGSTSPCHAPLFGRTPEGSLSSEPCSAFPYQLEPVNSRDDPNTGDVTPLGIVGMMGSVSEWTQDSFWPYASACWYSASLIDPVCTEQNALQLSIRGDAYDSNAFPLVTHAGSPPRASGADLGLRCAYPAP